MQLTSSQLDGYHREGYLFFEGLFDRDEVSTLTARVPGIFALDRPEIVREKDSGVARTAFAPQYYDDAFARLARHPRLIEPAVQILGDRVYMHQFKINAKAAFDGEVWQWHQDYGTWVNDDLMPEPRAMNVALFLDDVTEFNGALMFIPRSQRRGVLEAGHDLETTSYPLWTIDHATIRRLVEEGGLVAPKGPAGSMLLFHCNLVHASPANISPWDRNIVYLSLNRCDNAIRQFKRPEYIAHRDFTPIESLPDDCLRSLTAGSATR